MYCQRAIHLLPRETVQGLEYIIIPFSHIFPHKHRNTAIFCITFLSVWVIQAKISKVEELRKMMHLQNNQGSALDWVLQTHQSYPEWAWSQQVQFPLSLLAMVKWSRYASLFFCSWTFNHNMEAFTRKTNTYYVPACIPICICSLYFRV